MRENAPSSSEEPDPLPRWKASPHPRDRLAPFNDHEVRLGDAGFRSEAVSEADDRFLAFVGYDPEGYFLEFDTFLEHEANTELLEMLGRSREPRWDDLAALARAAD